MDITAVEFRKKWQKENPNTIHIPSEHEIQLMEKYARHYAAIELSIMNETKKECTRPSLLKKLNGFVRLWVWGVCPECNHDAPKLYDCEICNYYKELPRYRSEQTKEIKTEVWISFLRGVAK